TAAFTPDGPNGPRRAFKGGALLAAQRAGVPVVPLHADANRAWRLRSWDRFLVPKPFARVRVVYGAPFEVPEGADALAAAERRATDELDRAVLEAAWPAAATGTA
ncbi:MAG: lysophospholipid acyltransferase family protein, partial [Gemmatimonadales bacterium]